MIKVCDAIMGAGKTMSAINYMNERPGHKFIYITPYLDEASRIANECPALHFVQPVKTNPKTKFQKVVDTAAHLVAGDNIASTHQAFTHYTPEMLQIIRDKHYTLVLDESVNILEKVVEHSSDMRMAIDSGRIAENDGVYVLADESYDGNWLKDTVKVMKNYQLHRIQMDDGNEEMFYWIVPLELIDAFDEVIIMTYMFESYDLYYQLLISKRPFQKIGVRKDDTGYHFDEHVTNYMPEYARHLHDMIHICEHAKLNKIGQRNNALSMNWYANNKAGVATLKKNLYNYFRNIVGDHPLSERMFGTYDDYKESKGGIAPRCAISKYVPFNKRASNEFRMRRVLAYPVNIFVNVGNKIYYRKNGVYFDEDAFATSMMVQWIWRSAIRDGREIWIYIPSSRMRNLLYKWIADVERQYREYQRHILVPSGQTEEVA